MGLPIRMRYCLGQTAEWVRDDKYAECTLSHMSVECFLHSLSGHYIPYFRALWDTWTYMYSRCVMEAVDPLVAHVTYFLIVYSQNKWAEPSLCSLLLYRNDCYRGLRLSLLFVLVLAQQQQADCEASAK